ncbi:BEM_HP_G0080570.mRNA.1.CDS.1 [Saccharomyces cerevisiae]|nr:BEM_HP_G0080570.mRNA.1.CDS.1 [Saccharomyces cerevisiae]CAI6992298.1 BEM_HP_G0080570.mRNA.1.CDS.1 [Saccharomyces cerevisiae]
MPINAVNVVISTQLGAQLIWGFSFVVGVPVHRKVFGSRDDDAFSNVKSLSMDRWTREDIDELVSLGGNRGMLGSGIPKMSLFLLMEMMTKLSWSITLETSIFWVNSGMMK